MEKNFCDDQEIFDATAEETQLFFLRERATPTDLYTETWCFELERPIERDRLEDSIKQVIEMNPALRMNFFMENGKIKKKVNCSSPLVSVHRSEEVLIDDLIEQLKTYPFDLIHEPLIQFHIWMNELTDEKYLIINSHHIVTDGWTKNLLLEELMDGYFNKSEGELPKKTFIPHNKALNQRKKEKYEEYYEKINDIPNRVNKYGKVQQNYSGFTKTIEVKPDVIEEINQFCSDNRISMFSFYLGSFYSYICTYSGEQRMRIGVPFANRQTEQEQKSMGYFVNILPFGLDADICSLAQNQGEFYHFIQRNVLQLSAFQMFTFSDISRLLDSDDRQPFRTVFSYQESHSFNGIKKEINTSQNGAKFELTGNVKKMGDQVYLEFEFSDEVWTPEEGAYFIQCFEEWLIKSLRGQLIEAVNNPLPSLNQRILSGLEKEEPSVATIFEKFMNAAREQENRAAIITEQGVITYRELVDKVNLYARAIENLQIRENDFVSLQLERSPQAIAIMLALTKNGITYLHLSPYYPEERTKYIVSDSQTTVIITDDSEKKLEALTGVTTYTIAELENDLWSDQVISQDRPKHTNDIFSLIYTSGTTGQPKGVKISHQNILNYCSNFNEFGFTVEDIFSQCSSFTFDACLFEVWFPLLNGASIRIIPDPVTDERNWRFAGVANAPTISFLTTALFNSFVENGSILHFSATKKIFFGGEAASSKFINKALKLLENTNLYNAYGPTENTTYTTLYPISRDENQLLSLGSPINNVTVGILGTSGQLMPVNCMGEIVIAGKSLTEGYFNQNELNEAKFIFLQTDKGIQRFYKTGDIGKIGLDSRLYFQFRKDRQVKIRGFRVELSEIETSAQQIEGIEKCIVSFEKEGLKGSLTLYYEGTIEEEAVRQAVSEVLPAYMIPNEIIRVEEIKLTVNGKVDKKSIDRKEKAQICQQEEWTSLERVIGDSIEENIGTKGLRRTDNFYEIGIDSIISMQICAGLQAHGLQVSIPELFQYQSIQSLARYLESKGTDTTTVSRPTAWKSNKLSPIQKWFFDSEYANPSHWNQSVVIKMEPRITKEMVIASLRQIIDHYVIFQSYFQQVNGQWEQFIKVDEKEYFIDSFVVEDESAIEDIIARQQKSLDIGRKIYQFSIIQNEGSLTVHMAAHHLIIDGISWRNILRNLSHYLNDTPDSRQPVLESRTFNEWVEYIDNYYVSPEIARYWGKVHETDEVKEFGLYREYQEEMLSFTKTQTQELKELVQSKLFGDMEATLLAITSHALFEVYGWQQPVTVQMEGHGRPTNDAGFTTTIGWFTSIYPLTVIKDETLRNTIIGLHNQILNIPNKGMDYQLLNPISFHSDWTFNYMGEFDSKGYSGFEIASLFRTDDFGSDTRAPYDLSIVPIISDGRLEVRASYNAEGYDKESIKQFLFIFENMLGQLLKEEIPDYLPTTPLQKGMLLQSMRNPNSGNYIIQWHMLAEELDLNRLQSAISRLIKFSPALRSTFMMIDGEAIQVVRNVEDIQQRSVIKFMDWSDLSLDQAESELNQLLNIQRRQTYDFINGPLFRFSVIKLKTAFVLVFEHHHLILDGWSMTYLFENLSAFYDTPELNNEISDSYMTMKKLMRKSNLTPNLQNWEGVLSNYTPVEFLNLNHKHDSSNVIMHDSIDEVSGIYDYLRTHKITMNQFFQLVWSVTLLQLFGRDDVLFAVTSSGRNSFKKDELGTIGMFISTLPFRVKLPSEQATMEQLIEIVRDNAHKIQEYDRISWIEIADYFGEDPEIQIGYVYENYPIHSDSGTFSMEKFQGKEQVEFPLAISITEKVNRIEYELHAQENYFNEDMLKSTNLIIKKIIQHLQSGVEDYASLVELLHCDSTIFPQSHEQAASEKVFSEEIVNYFKKYSSRTYIRNIKKSMTYGEALEIVDQLIQITQLSEGDVVAVLTEDRAKMTIYALACFVSGATYVPLSSEFNKERIEYILQDSKANCVFTEQGAFTRLSFDKDVNNHAYIIYTSGTTGTPKGVIITQENIQNSIEALYSENIVDMEDIYYQNIAMTFDPSIMDILLPLYSGASIYISEERLYGAEMERVLSEEKVTIFTATPSLLRVLDLNGLPCLNKLIVGGEQLRRSDLENVPGSTVIYNMYGPTETTIVASIFEINEKNRQHYAAYPIGKVLKKLNAYSYSSKGKMLPFGMPGELVLEGSLVSAGYTNPLLNEHRFDNTLEKENKKKYLTGDIGYISRNECISFIGRKDRQVKIRGYRVELNEIEQSISTLFEANNYQLLMNEEKTTLLLAYLGNMSEDRVRNQLKGLLPVYMVPSVIKGVDEFPLHSNGKIDFNALRTTLLQNTQQPSDPIMGTSLIQQELGEIWKDILNISNLSLEDNFFEIGGNSLLAIQLVRKVNEKTNFNVTIQQLFGANSFEEFVKEIEGGVKSEENYILS
ncbi:amino acid adenylation domain-containing protein [Paenibacillus sp. SN-8-1]|uniref:amino acid adenylation domain-containing protein n=1 Tax=Paenibacillus sp. SN-8-1 TaxID=3435409 RepID=UPI003D9A361F